MRWKAIFFVILFSFTTSIWAQWSSDSTQNTPIVALSGDQVVPKIKATSDGGCYVSWYDNRSGNYAVYLQRLTRNGEKVWAIDGLLVSDHPQDSWVTDYDLAVDQDDNAILVFNDIRNGSENGWDVFAYKISPSGEFLWGPDGICLSPAVNSEGEMSPKVTVTSAGNYVFAWTRSGDNDVVALQKLSSDGTKMWGENGITIAGQQSGDANHPQIISAANDSVIVLWKNVIGSYPATKIFLLMQKLTPQGTFAWGENGVLIYDNEHIPVYYDPVMIPDGNSGAFVAWAEQPSPSESYVEVGHVAADGSLIFPLNGIKTALTASRLHMAPSISFNQSLNALFVFWLEENSSQNQFGIYGQRLDAQGNRLWGDDGKVFIPLGERSISYVRCAATDTSEYVGYFQSSGANTYDEAVKDFLLDTDGNFLWGPVILSAASLGEKDDLVLTLNPSNQLFFAWTDKRSDSGDIYAQNSNPDGTMGNWVAHLENALPRHPRSFVLFPGFPNPFNPATHIRVALPHDAHISLCIYDMTGRLVRTLYRGNLPSGVHTFRWDGRKENGRTAPSGIYFCQFRAKDYSATQKLILLK